MGQEYSTSVAFEDCWSASEVKGRANRIRCKKSCSFTQYSEKVFPMDVGCSVTCKVYSSCNSPVAFGLVPEHQTKACRNYLVGHREIYGSIGCHVSHDTVSLMTNGKRFFQGSYQAGNYYTITMKISHGKLAFYVDGSKVNSEELEAMSFHGSYKAGVSMDTAGQQAEVFFDCPVTFEDCWSAGDVKKEMLLGLKSTNFTLYSEQALQPQSCITITANVLRNCGNSVGLGTVPVECQDLCRSKIVGMERGMVGCIVKDGNVFIAINGDVVFAADVNTNDPCVLTMKIDQGQVSYQFDGKDINCDRLETLRLTGDYRVGVGLSCEGQVVEMRGDGKFPGRKVPVKQSSSGSSSGDKDKVELVEQLIGLLAEAGLGSTSTGDSSNPRWKDNMKSIDCDNDDLVAVCVRKYTATLFTQCVVPASGHDSIDIRILSMKPGQLMMVGIMDTKTDNHGDHHLGAHGLNNSLGLTSRGDVILKGATYATGNGFVPGDLVSLSFNGGKLSVKVNGNEAVPEIGNLNFQSKFRWAVSFTDVSQAVKIGSGSLTSDESSFCHRKGCNNPQTSPGYNSPHSYNSPGSQPSPRQSTSFETCSTASATTFMTATSSSSYDITDCFVDSNDLIYGGRSLGEGSFGKVFKGKWDGSDVAIKEIPWQEKELQLREIAVGRTLTHPNIATIMGWSRKESSLLVLMPLFRNGSLQDKLAGVSKSASPTPLTGGHLGFDFVFKVALGILRALKYMASRQPHPVVHRDVKPANVLLDDNNHPMLTDFGTARSLEATSATTHVGTPFYMAPEQATDQGASPATDVYAAALIIYEVLSVPRQSRQSKSLMGIMNEIAQGTIPPMHDVPKNIADILVPAFSTDPKSRPTAAQMASSIEKARSMFSTT